MFLVVIMGFLKKSITNQFEIDGIEELKKQLNIPIIATLGKNGWQKIDSFYASGARIFRINGSHIADEEEADADSHGGAEGREQPQRDFYQQR